ncbi:MAG: hypothetical protein ACR2GD_07065 [Pyrinomonadaceae bacterium]
MIFVVVGCGALTDRATKAVTGEEKKSASGSNQSTSSGAPVDSDDDESTGVPECDQAIKTITTKLRATRLTATIAGRCAEREDLCSPR